MLNLLYSVSQDSILVLCLDFLDIEGVTRAIGYLVLEDINRIVLVVIDVDGVALDVMNKLGDVLRSSAPDEGAGYHESENVHNRTWKDAKDAFLDELR